MDGGGLMALIVALAWAAVEANRRYRHDTPQCLREDAVRLLARADGMDARRATEEESRKKWRALTTAHEEEVCE